MTSDGEFSAEQDNADERVVTPRRFRGRGSSLELGNRFERIHREFDPEQLEPDDLRAVLDQKIETEYFFDDSGSVVNENQSPDLDFRFSLNPYRGCAHGCSYCYARPTHEYLGLNAGIDFESKIIVKPNAPELFAKWLRRPKWKGNVEPVMFSGVTDCYQPCEKQFELTRRCLEVALSMRQPIRIITKNALIRRDLDLLAELARLNLVCVTMSLCSLDQSLIRVMEPRTSAPVARLDTIELLSAAGVPVKVLMAPIMPAINEQEIPELLQQVAAAGGMFAAYVMLRLPLSVEPVFLAWLDRHFSDRKSKIVGRLRSLGDGKIYDSNFGNRMKGQGIWAEQIHRLFDTCCRKHNLQTETPALACDQFRLTDSAGSHQLELF